MDGNRWYQSLMEKSDSIYLYKRNRIRLAKYLILLVVIGCFLEWTASISYNYIIFNAFYILEVCHVNILVI